MPCENGAALAQPAQGSLDDPSAGGMSLATASVQLLLTDPANARRVRAIPRGSVCSRMVTALVQAKMLLLS